MFERKVTYDAVTGYSLEEGKGAMKYSLLDIGKTSANVGGKRTPEAKDSMIKGMGVGK